MRAGVTRILSAHPGGCAGAAGVGMPAAPVSMMVRIVRYRSDGSAYAHENGSGIVWSAMSWRMRPGRIRGMPAGPYVE